MVHFSCYDSPFGQLIIGYEDNCIVSIRHGSISENHTSAISDQAAMQLLEYFEGRRKRFDLPLSLHGTPFQKAVWDCLLQIPYGETRTYGEIATQIGHPKAARAVGMACNKNPVWIVIPCHRVVGSNQTLTGYAGGLDMKRRLLELEHTI